MKTKPPWSLFTADNHVSDIITVDEVANVLSQAFQTLLVLYITFGSLVGYRDFNGDFPGRGVSPVKCLCITNACRFFPLQVLAIFEEDGREVPLQR